MACQSTDSLTIPRRSFTGDLQGFLQDRVRRSGLRTRSLTFQFQVEVLKIFLKLFIVQGFVRFTGRGKSRVFGTFPRGKQVRRSRAPRGRNWVRSRTHGRHELSWLGRHWLWTDGSTVVKGIDMRAALLWLLRGKSGPAWRALLLVIPSYAVAGAAVGAGCARVPRVSHRYFWKNFLFFVACLAAPCRVVRTWKTGHFHFALVSFSLFWRLYVACGVQRIGFFGGSCVHLTWFDSGHMFFEGLGRIYNFQRCGELESRGVWLSIRLGGEVCTVDASGCSLLSARFALWKLEQYFNERCTFCAVCGNFRCVVQHFPGPSMMKNSSSSRAHANSLPSDVATDTVVQDRAKKQQQLWKCQRTWCLSCLGSLSSRSSTFQFLAHVTRTEFPRCLLSSRSVTFSSSRWRSS